MKLLGPNGLPMDQYRAKTTQEFKKAPAPKMGPAFGDWAGRDTLVNQMPGGAILQFDLSKLTLADFRAMRDHPQINASLSVLTFMMHGLDWWIECEDKKIATQIEDNIRRVWTRLIRGASVAYWAGYAPNALEFDNDLGNGKIVLTKIKDLLPEECTVNWKEVEGWAPPQASARPKFKEYDGIKQFGRQFPIPVENCVHPDTPILCADYTWKPAGSLDVGQEIIAFEDKPGPRGRKFCKATIEVNNRGVKPMVRITTDIGDPIEASVDHPFLVYRLLPTSKYGWTWAEARDLKPGDEIAHLGRPDEWAYDESREAGWVAGMFDGEGCISTNGLTISQNSGVVLDQLKQILADKGFDFHATANTRDKCVSLALRGGVREVARFLAVFRPHRLCANFPGVFEGVYIKGNKSVDRAVVTFVDDIGEGAIASIQTSSGTFVTGGYLSHNTFWYPVLMENGDYYGRKLLRPAFSSWYFSILVHLFANRYFERFGEPLAVGRAPFDDDLPTRDSQGNPTTITGKQAMEDILMNLRNRSVVVLPNDIIPSSRIAGDKTAYEYSIEYMESQLRGVDFERYLGRLDEEMSLGIFTPTLLFRTADVGSYNLGVGHMQLFLWMLNALAGDFKEYVDNHIINRLKNINYGINKPRAEFQFRRMGKENVETVRALLDELVKQGKTMPDLDELGMIAGLTLKEVRQVTEPEADPTEEDDRGQRDKPKSSGPRGVGQPRATGKQISNRIKGQVEKAWKERSFGKDFEPSLGYKRKFEESLKAEGASPAEAMRLTERFYSRMESWMDDAIGLGMDEFSGPDDFTNMFERLMEVEIEDLSNA